MDSKKFIELLEKDIRETRNLTLAIEEETRRIGQLADAGRKSADDAWEVVRKTREEIKARREMPFWKKIFG
jgi:hypothetical protein